MPHRIRAFWRTIEPFFQVVDNVEEVTEAAVDTAEAEVRAALKQRPALAGRKFALPPTMRAFYLVAQNRLRRAPKLGEDPFGFYAIEWLATDGLALADEARGDSTPWLEVAAFGENHWVFLNCDPEDPLYGALVERRDSTPWSQTVYEDEVHPDLGAFLRTLRPETG